MKGPPDAYPKHLVQQFAEKAELASQAPDRTLALLAILLSTFFFKNFIWLNLYGFAIYFRLFLRLFAWGSGKAPPESKKPNRSSSKFLRYFRYIRQHAERIWDIFLLSDERVGQRNQSITELEKEFHSSWGFLFLFHA